MLHSKKVEKEVRLRFLIIPHRLPSSCMELILYTNDGNFVLTSVLVNREITEAMIEDSRVTERGTAEEETFRYMTSFFPCLPPRSKVMFTLSLLVLYL